MTKDTIVTIWIDSTDARKVVDKGYRIVHAAADYFYLVSQASQKSDSLGPRSRRMDWAGGRVRLMGGQLQDLAENVLVRPSL